MTDLQSLLEELRDGTHFASLVEEAVVQAEVCVLVVKVEENHFEMSIVLKSEKIFNIEFRVLEFIPGETEGFF